MELHKFGLANEVEVITNTAESKLCGCQRLEELISCRPFLKVEIKFSMFSLSEREAQIRRLKKRTG